MSIPAEALPACVAGGVGILAAAAFVFTGASSQPTSWDKEVKAEDAEDDDDDDQQDDEQEDEQDEGKEAARSSKSKAGQSKPESQEKAKDAEEKVDRETKCGSGDKTKVDASVSEKEGVQPKGDDDLPVNFLKMRRGKLSADQEAKFRQGLANLPPESKKALQDWVNTTENTRTLLGLNCLFLVFILGVLTLAAAAVVGFLQINIFNPDVWREGISKLQIESAGFWSQVTAPDARARQIAHDRHADLAEL